MPRGIQPSKSDLSSFSRYRSVELAAACDPPLNRRTVERAKADENIHPMCLRMLREAVARLDAARGATTPSPAFAPPVAALPNVPNQAAAHTSARPSFVSP